MLNEQIDAVDGVSVKWAAIISAFTAKTAHAAEKVGAVLAVGGGITSTEWAAFGGLFIALLGYVTSQTMNWYFKRKEDQRMQEEHDARMAGKL